jgi:hypothetical protein
MELTSDQRKIIDLVNQLPDDVRGNTLEMLSQMRTSTDTTKKDIKDIMLSPDVTKEEKEILEKYKATKKIIDEFHQFCLTVPEEGKESPDFWDRTAISVESISQLALPLLKIWDKQVWFDKKNDTIINDLKSDLLKTYITRYFLRDAGESKTINQFKDDLNKEIPQRIKKFNESIAGSKIGMDIDTIDGNSKQGTIADFNKKLVTAFEKLDKFEKNKEFVDKMWDNFVKDFLQKAEKIRQPRGKNKFEWDGNEIELKEYKAWFFEQIFNIAYHAADYIDCMKNDTNIIYNFNYQLLHNNFNISKSDHYDFQVNHIEKSTDYSNIIYKWAEELGIKKLKVLVGKYLIKP